MKKKPFKRSMALLLSLLLVVCSLPFVSFAADDAGITIKSNVSAQDDTVIDEGIEFTYYVEINGEPFNGTATGSDGSTYNITDGMLTMPYDVSAVLDDVADGSSYSIKRMTYDNDKYALLSETEAQTGELISKEYYVSVNGAEETKISSEEFNKATDNGTNLTVTEYVDSEGNTYDDSQLTNVTAFDAVRKEGIKTTYSFEQKDYRYVTDSLNEYNMTYNIDKSYSESGNSLFKTYTFNANVSVQIDGYDLGADVETTESANGVFTKKQTARETCISNVKTSMTRLAYRILTENIEAQTGKKAVLAEDVTAQLPDQSMWSDNTETLQYKVNAISFTEVTEQTSVYRAVDVSASKEIAFDAVFAPAPTGSFTVDFMLYDGLNPVAFEGASFEVCDMLGTPLTQGEDYNLEVKDASFTIPVVGTIGFTKYVFSGLKHGSYTVRQTGGQDGYIVDKTAYSFEVARTDAAVTGDNFAKSDFGDYTALTNNTYNFVKSFKVFKNNSISINFTKVDQNGEPVQGASFMLIERDALLQFVRDIAQAGINSIGSIDIQSIIQ